MVYQLDGITIRSDWIHADMTLREFHEALGGVRLIAIPPFLLTLAKIFPRISAAIFYDLLKNSDLMMSLQKTRGESNPKIRAFLDVIITKRNSIAMKKLVEEIKHSDVALIYGAGHMEDFDQRLTSMGFEIVSTRWITALPRQMPKVPD